MDRLRELSNYVYGLNYDSFNSEIIKLTKVYIIDYYASCYAGMKINKNFSDIVCECIDETGDNGNCSVLEKERKYSVLSAAFLNAIYAHGADMDDGNKKAMGHVAAHVISTAFSVAEEIGSSGKDIIVAINVGYEIYNRVAASVQPGLVHRGFHSTGTAGAIACAAVASKLYNLSANEIYNAMSFASVQSSGLIIIAESGQTCKPINPANAARTGIFSAKCAKKGIVAPLNTFESKKGWAHAMSEQIDDNLLFEGLGKKFTIAESYLKPYPSCRHTHCGIESLIQIRKNILKDGKKISDISSIKIYIYRNAIMIAGQIKVPQSNEDTKFSIHYSAACAIANGCFGLDDLNSSSISNETKKVIEKITLVEDESMENVKNGIRGAKVVVVMNDGTEYEHTVLVPKGDPDNPFTEKDLFEKLENCSEGHLSDCNKLINAVNSLDNITIFKGINSLLGENDD